MGRWTRYLGIDYPGSFPIHGDLPDVWHDSYDDAIPCSKRYSFRSQPRDPNVACAALRKMARFLGAGRKLKVKLCPKDRWSYNILKALGQKKKAEKIRQGLPSSDEESEDSSDSSESGTLLGQVSDEE